MILAYRIWTWTAILLLAFGSITVFAVFLVTAFRQLRAEKHLDPRPRPQRKRKEKGSPIRGRVKRKNTSP